MSFTLFGLESHDLLTEERPDISENLRLAALIMVATVSDWLETLCFELKTFSLVPQPIQSTQDSQVRNTFC